MEEGSEVAGSIFVAKRKERELAGKSWQSPVKAIDQCGFHKAKAVKGLLQGVRRRAFMQARGGERGRARAYLVAAFAGSSTPEPENQVPGWSKIAARRAAIPQLEEP